MSISLVSFSPDSSFPLAIINKGISLTIIGDLINYLLGYWAKAPIVEQWWLLLGMERRN